MDTQETGYKKRIKQKSLSAIFAKKLKEANSDCRNVLHPQIPSKNKDLTAKAAKPKRIEQSNVISKKKSDKISSTVNFDSINESTVSFTNAIKEHIDRTPLKRKDKSKVENQSKKSFSTIFSNQLKNQSEADLLNSTKKHNIPKNNFKLDKTCKVINELLVLKSDKIPSTANFDSTNESIVSFTKTTKENVGRTLLAKKRDDSKSESRRSLSDIFSNQWKNQNELNALNLIQKHIFKDNFKSDKKYKVTKESSVLKNTKKTDILNKKKKKRSKKKIVNNNKESDENLKLMHRASGKMSSLFGNNPDVPTIGQRFVKPVNEPVFTEITFADLNIHPYMVSIYDNKHLQRKYLQQNNNL